MEKVTIKISRKMYDRLRLLSLEYEPMPSDFNPMEYSGGNYDDAFHMGKTHGEEQLARDVVKDSEL